MTTKLKPRWRVKVYGRNRFGDLLFYITTPLGKYVRREPFLSIPDAMKAIRAKLDNNA